MDDPFGVGEVPVKKSVGLADAVNKILQNLCVLCAREEGVRDYFHVSVIGYGQSVGPAFGGPLAGQEIVPLSRMAENPARVETRVKKISDGAGGILDQTVKFPVWFEPVAVGGTPMCAAFDHATRIVRQWVASRPNGFPPIVINVTDGESSDGDPSAAAAAVTGVGGEDGSALLFNLHLSSNRAAAVEFPADAERLPDDYSRMLFRISSALPAPMLEYARNEIPGISNGAKGFAFNADLVTAIKFLNIGTRASNLR